MWQIKDVPASERTLTRPIILLLSVACGLNVANVYYAAPLLDAMARDFTIAPSAMGAVVTMTQIGYALGLIFIVPLGDLIDRRRLIVVQGVLSALALVGVASAPAASILLLCMTLVGLLAVVVQVLVAFAATWAAPHERGHVVGLVTSGVVIGILAARLISGMLTDLYGWRAVYFLSAVLTLAMSVVLFRTLPRSQEAISVSSYRVLIRSMFSLFRDEPVLLTHGAFAFLIFAMFNVLWTPLVLPLSAPPFSLSHAEVGLFGLAGVAGAIGAGWAGRWADRGFMRLTMVLSFTLALVAWGLMAALEWSLSALIAGVILLDFAIQAVHVSNQSVVFAVRPEARSRLAGGYMVFYSVGSAVGASASTFVYAHDGWLGVCGLGAFLALIGLFLWVAVKGYRPADTSIAMERDESRLSG